MQPADSGDEDEEPQGAAEQVAEALIPLTVLALDEGRQPVLIFDDIDKSHEIQGVPEELNGVFDRAVKFARKHCDDVTTREKVASNIWYYMDNYDPNRDNNMRHLRRPGHIDPEQWQDIKELIEAVEMFYNMELGGNITCKTEISKILEQYCFKITKITVGCLVFMLDVKDSELAHLILNLIYVAQRIRKVIVSIDVMQVEWGKYIKKKRNVRDEMQSFVLDVLERIINKVRIQISMRHQQMLRFKEEGIELTIMAKMSSSVLPSSGDKDERTKRTRKQIQSYIDQLKPFNFTWRALKFIQDADATFEKPMKDLALEERVEEEGDDIKESSKNAPSSELQEKPVGDFTSSSSSEPQVYKGLLSPPSSSSSAGAESGLRYEYSNTNVCIINPPPESTDRTLFDRCKEYGTILNVKALIDAYSNKCYQGFVEFADPASAEKAIVGLTEMTATKAAKPHQKLSDSTLMFKELPSDMDVTGLSSLVDKYGTLKRRYISQRHQGYVEFAVAADARKALEDLQKEGWLVVVAFEQRK